MKNYLMLGDTHSDLEFVEKAVALAAENDAEIIQLGDWGFLWPQSIQTGSLSNALTDQAFFIAKPPVKMRWCDGNHDWHPYLRNHFDCSGDGVEIAPNVIYQPRGSVYEDEDGTRFLFCGGAPSIDKWARTEGLSWWTEETITEAEYQRAMKAWGPIHVLVTHDAPDYPPGFAPKGSPDFREISRRSMEMVNNLIEWHRPKLHVHGHWHHYYSREHDNGVTKIVGLDCNNARFFNDAAMLWSRDLTSDEAGVK